jgi:hypothetical protein
LLVRKLGAVEGKRFATMAEQGARRNDARTAENGLATKSGVSKSAKVVLVNYKLSLNTFVLCYCVPASLNRSLSENLPS